MASFDLKLDRAREHLNSLEAEARAWIDTEPCKSIDEPDPETPPEPVPIGFQAKRLRIHKVVPTPLRLSLLVGDCVFNLRSSLDHLALALAQVFTPVMTDNQIRNSEFPIFETAQSYAKQSTRKIGCIAPVAQSAIELLQPYHNGTSYSTHPLWQIHQLNRIDKHRSLTVLGGFPIDGGDWIAKKNNVAEIAYFVPYSVHLDYRLPECNAILARWAGRPADRQKEMNMSLKAPFEPSFGDSHLAGLLITPVLKSLCDYVGDAVIAPLSKYL